MFAHRTTDWWQKVTGKGYWERLWVYWCPRVQSKTMTKIHLWFRQPLPGSKVCTKDAAAWGPRKMLNHKMYWRIHKPGWLIRKQKEFLKTWRTPKLLQTKPLQYILINTPNHWHLAKLPAELSWGLDLLPGKYFFRPEVQCMSSGSQQEE